MAIGPERVFAVRRARFVKKTWLRDQDKRTRWNFSARDVALCARNLIKRSTEMNGAGAATRFRFPWNP